MMMIRGKMRDISVQTHKHGETKIKETNKNWEAGKKTHERQTRVSAADNEGQQPIYNMT